MWWLWLTMMGIDAPSREHWARLHPTAVLASSWLQGAYSRYEENYHPRYVLDDDAKTAWTEGAPGSGAGEWLQLQLSPAVEVQAVRLLIRSGYQKSLQLLEANAAPAKTRVSLLTSGGRVLHSEQVTLTREAGWQELVVPLRDVPLVVEQVRLKAVTVHEGQTYADLCISDIQVWVDPVSDIDTAQQALHQQATLDWIAERQTAAEEGEQQRQDPLAGHTLTQISEETHPGAAYRQKRAALISLLKSTHEEGTLHRAEATHRPRSLKVEALDFAPLLGLEYLLDLSQVHLSETTDEWRSELRSATVPGRGEREIRYTRSNVRVAHDPTGQVSAISGEYRFKDWSVSQGMRGGTDRVGRRFVINFDRGLPKQILVADLDQDYGETEEYHYFSYWLVTFERESRGQITHVEVAGLGSSRWPLGDEVRVERFAVR